MKDAVAKRGDEPETNIPAAAPDDQIVANLPVQDIGHRVGVGNDRDRAVRLRAREQQPRIGTLLVG